MNPNPQTTRTYTTSPFAGPSPPPNTTPTAIDTDTDTDLATTSTPSRLESVASAASSGTVATSTSFSSSSAISPHYDPQRDIILTVECISDTQTKRLSQIIWLACVLGAGILITMLVIVATKPQEWWFQDQDIYVFNTTLASINITILLSAITFFFSRLYRAKGTGKRWSKRRKRAVMMSSVEIVLQFINSLLFLTANVHALTDACEWFHAPIIWTSFGRWTIWNSIFLIFLIQASNLFPVPKKVERISKQVLRTVEVPPGDASPSPSQLHKSTNGGSGSGQRPTHTEPVLYMDVPVWHQWKKGLYWITMESFLLAISIVLTTNDMVVTTTPDTSTPTSPPTTDCTTLSYSCHFTTAAFVLANLIAASAIIYFITYVVIIYRAFQMFYTRPYAPFRMGNLVLRFQVRQRGVAFTFFIANIIVYFYVRAGSCASYFISWHGLAPSQLVMTVVAATQAFLATPTKPEQSSILQVWLQEFAWTERDVERKKEERVSSLPEESFENFCMDCEPLFCFETAVKLMYWAFLAYDTGELPDSPFTPATALGLFDLTHFEVVWEKKLNTKAVIGWNDATATVVIAFRGTVDANNMLADLQVWRSRYPLVGQGGRGTPWLGTASMVHKGFLRAYTTNGFNDRLLSKVEHILNRCQAFKSSSSTHTHNHSHDHNHDHDHDHPHGKEEGQQQEQEDRPPVRVLVTGHSLGGAMAVLCAYDIATRGPCAQYDVELSCYTFGAPRVGNHAWAKEYNMRVADTWQIINSDDVVTRAGKFLIFFKHVGHRVLLNRRGDLVVRPSFVEYSLRRSPGGSIRDHYLTSYQRAVVAVVAAQFGAKSLGLGGKEGVMALSESVETKGILERAGLSLDDVIRLEEGRGEVSVGASMADARRREGGDKEDHRGRDVGMGVTAAAKLHGWWDSMAAWWSGRRALDKIRIGAGAGAEQVQVPESDVGGVAYERATETGLLSAQRACKMANRGAGGRKHPRQERMSEPTPL